MNEITLSYDDALDRIEAEMMAMDANHEFETSGFLVDGIYVRTIYIPAGSYLTSKIHKTNHPFVLSAGTITLFTEDGGKQEISAPFIDITKSGTRRFAKAETDCLWTTFHRVEGKTEEEIEKEVVEDRVNKILINKINY